MMSKVILVAQVKGGCGKSTVAMQVIAPWVMSREGGARLIEVDHQNQDSADYSNTGVLTQQIQIPQSDSHSYAVTRLMQEVIKSDESIVIDLGGNATASDVITEMGVKGLSSFIDLVIVPVSASGRDVLNAEATIAHIRECFSGFNSPIAIVYTRAETMDIDRLKHEVPDVFRLAESAGVGGPLVVPQRTCLAASRYLLLTAWELGQRGADMIVEIQEKQLQAKRQKDIEAGTQLVTMRTTVEQAVNMKPIFEQLFSDLDSLLPLGDTHQPGEGGQKRSKQPKAGEVAHE